MDIFVSGSLALDRIMDFPGRFSDHILPDKVHVLNVSFTVNGVVERFGGTAGNIAYALSLLDEKPRILATIGRDHGGYFRWLEENGISIDDIKIIDEEFTASAYITTDRADNQITGFNPGAMKRSSPFAFDEVDPRESIVIVAPGNLDDMKDYPRVCRAKGIPYIFDPGQSLPMWDGKDLAQAIEGSKLLVSNDYELELIARKTGLGRERLIGLTEAIVTTRGEKGSVVHTKDERTDMPAVKVDKAVDPTGAGDAYRAGLIKGLVQGKDLRYCAVLGTVVASFAVECRGTQEYTFAMREFEARLKEHLADIGTL